MATNWTGNKTDKRDINGGHQFEAGDAVVAADLNAAFNNSIYASEFVSGMTAEAGTNANTPGTPSVSFDANTKKFTFEYLKGTPGSPGAAAGFGTPTISVSTLAAGSSATASVSADAQSPDTSKVFAFSFGIPRGADGVTPTIQAANGDDIATVGTPSVSANTVGTTTTFTFHQLKGQQGSAGARGGVWYTGTAITGTSTTGTVFSGSGITSAIVGDMYLNTSTSNVYKCTLGGNASTAKWAYTMNIKGAAGSAATINGSSANTLSFSLTNTTLTITVG